MFPYIFIFLYPYFNFLFVTFSLELIFFSVHCHRIFFIRPTKYYFVYILLCHLIVFCSIYFSISLFKFFILHSLLLCISFIKMPIVRLLLLIVSLILIVLLVIIFLFVICISFSFLLFIVKIFFYRLESFVYILKPF